MFYSGSYFNVLYHKMGETRPEGHRSEVFPEAGRHPVLNRGGGKPQRYLCRLTSRHYKTDQQVSPGYSFWIIFLELLPLHRVTIRKFVKYRGTSVGLATVQLSDRAAPCGQNTHTHPVESRGNTVTANNHQFTTSCGSHRADSSSAD